MLAVVLSLAALAASPPPVDASKVAACKPTLIMPTTRSGRAERPRRLGELPPARHQLAVLRTVDGCAVASVVSYDPATRQRTVTFEPVGRAQADHAARSAR